LIRCVAQRLASLAAPVVLDPVMVAKSGDALLQDAAVDSLRTELVPRATLLTPNLPEAARLLETSQARTESQVEAQARGLLELGPGAVLMKGGHAGGLRCVDILVSNEGPSQRFEAERVDTRNTHGTGCTLSSAIAAGLAKALPLDHAVAEAHTYLQGAIRAGAHSSVGSGHGPVHHFHRHWS
ncbi:MAG: bifunctional hydroxymethylpyrimidine kinase/phosphomethylpyrimidine kinase, partial [Gammaproteobacteria bacterium]